MQHDSLADRTLIVPAFVPVALPAAATAGVLVDTLGWDGACFIITPASIAGGATLDGYVKRDSASAFTTSTNITNAALVQITSSAANSSGTAVIDVYRPSQRYLKLVLTSGAASVTVAASCVLYRRSGILPATQTAIQVVKVAENFKPVSLFAPSPTALSVDQAREALAAEWDRRAPTTASAIADFHRTSVAAVEEIAAIHRTPERQRLTSMIVNVAQQIGATVVYDVGAGDGHDLRAMTGLPSDPALLAVEPNETLTQRLRDAGVTPCSRIQDADIEAASLVLCIDVLPRVPDAAVWLAFWACRMRLGAVLIERCPSDDTWLPLTLTENHAWLPGPTLERLGFVQIVDPIDGMRVWQRMGETGTARASLILCAYRDVAPETLKSIIGLRDRGWRFMSKHGDALIDRSRAMVVSQWFRETADDVFLMVDNDVVFVPEAAEIVVDRCRSGMDVVGGVYPARDGGHLILRGEDGESLGGPDLFGPGLEPVKTRHVGTGFMAVHRRVIAALVETMPLCHTNKPWAFWPMFQPYPTEDVFAGGWNYLSEDYAFCDRVRALGFSVWTDRTVRLGHLSQVEVTLQNMDLIHAAVTGR